MPRVAALYRVSTKAQLDENDDIPMQKKAAAEFIEKQKDWILVKEYIEGGVSGFKKSAEQRDVIIQARKDALNKEFDILLVFMFDRLGRKADETPHVLKWFCKNGISVWSIKEGERKFDSHMDDLLNYITYWQSDGESKKTSARVKEAMKQMVQEGKFRGGFAPYGYDTIPSGEYNKNGKELLKLSINFEEADVVRLIFNLYTDHGYGSLRIINYLNEKKILSKSGNAWRRTAVSKLLKNPIYIGIMKSDNEIQEIYTHDYKIDYKSAKRQVPVYSSQIDESLIIIDEEIFNKAQAILNIKKGAPKGRDELLNVPTKGHLLFSGFIYCGYCGSSLINKHHYVYWTNKDGKKIDMESTNIYA